MKGKVLSCFAIVLLIVLLCVFAGCSSSKFPDVKLDIQADNLMKDAKIVGDNLTNKEISGRQNLLKEGSSYWTAINDGKSNVVQFKLNGSKTFNTAIISEIGDSIMYFRLDAFIGGNWKTIYSSEKMQERRIISFDSVATDSIRLVIEKFKKDTCKIKSFELYNISNAKDNFNTTVYQRLDVDVPTEILKRSPEEIKTFARYYDVYNTIIIFDVVKWNEKGEMSFVGGEDNFAKQIKALKEIVKQKSNPHKVNIIITALADGAGGDGHNGVNKLMSANHTRIAEQMVNKFIKPESEGGYDLDGLDIDWEYPQTKADWKCYDTFIQELDEKMTAVKESSIISAALSAAALKMSKETMQRIDQIQYMAYDDINVDGYQSTLYYAQKGLQNFIDKGANLSQINIGIPSYGRPIDGGPYWPSWRYVNGQNMYFDSIYENVKCDKDVYMTSAFCSPALAGDKTALALFSGCGGIMVFRLACDKLMSDPNAVACGIENTLRRYIPSWWRQ